MNVEWCDEPQVTGIGRDPQQVREFLAELQANPKRYAVYSEHSTRGAARQRVYALKSSSNFRDQPLVWRTRRVNPGDLTSPVRVLVCWNPDGDQRAEDGVEWDEQDADD